MNVTPYLFFEGRCEEAMEFYKKALGAQMLFMMRFKDGPKPEAGASSAEQGGCGSPDPQKVMHMTLKIGNTTLMASDGRCSGKPNFHGISLSLDAATDAEAEKLFTALSEGGQVQMPMAKTFYASSFGMVADKFGLWWMIIAGQN